MLAGAGSGGSEIRNRICDTVYTLLAAVVLSPAHIAKQSDIFPVSPSFKPLAGPQAKAVRRSPRPRQ